MRLLAVSVRRMLEVTSLTTQERLQVHASALLPLIGTTLSRPSSSRGRSAAVALEADEVNVIYHVVTFYATAAPGTPSLNLPAALWKAYACALRNSGHRTMCLKITPVQT